MNIWFCSLSLWILFWGSCCFKNQMGCHRALEQVEVKRRQVGLQYREKQGDEGLLGIEKENLFGWLWFLPINEKGPPFFFLIVFANYVSCTTGKKLILPLCNSFTLFIFFILCTFFSIFFFLLKSHSKLSKIFKSIGKVLDPSFFIQIHVFWKVFFGWNIHEQSGQKQKKTDVEDEHPCPVEVVCWVICLI